MSGCFHTIISYSRQSMCRRTKCCEIWVYEFQKDLLHYEDPSLGMLIITRWSQTITECLFSLLPFIYPPAGAYKRGLLFNKQGLKRWHPNTSGHKYAHKKSNLLQSSYMKCFWYDTMHMISLGSNGCTIDIQNNSFLTRLVLCILPCELLCVRVRHGTMVPSSLENSAAWPSPREP